MKEPVRVRVASESSLHAQLGACLNLRTAPVAVAGGRGSAPGAQAAPPTEQPAAPGQ
jgi:hypothetical protein